MTETVVFLFVVVVLLLLCFLVFSLSIFVLIFFVDMPCMRFITYMFVYHFGVNLMLFINNL